MTGWHRHRGYAGKISHTVWEAALPQPTKRIRRPPDIELQGVEILWWTDGPSGMAKYKARHYWFEVFAEERFLCAPVCLECGHPHTFTGGR